jgi:cell division septum initiation protein DivIVA
MNENSNLLPDLLHEEFELQVRGYSRRQVDDFVARRSSEIRELEQRLSRALDEAEHLRRELSATRQQALNGRPAHQEVSERIAKILELADDEARAQKDKANEEIGRFRGEALAEIDRMRADAREQTERMLTAAQEQADRTLATARVEADRTRTSARSEADRLTDDARKKADTSLASAKAQSKRMLDEATARATAIHDGAERRLNLLSNRHGETIRRLSDILEGVSGLVAAETARPSLEDEVALTVAKAVGSRPAEITDGAEGPSALAGSSLLSPPHPSTRVNGPVAPPERMTGVPGTAPAAPPVRPLGRGARQAGGPPIASPAPQPAPAATPPIAAPASQPGQAATAPIAAPATQPGQAATPPMATSAPRPGQAATAPIATSAPTQDSSPAVTGASGTGDTAWPATRSVGADAAMAEPSASSVEQTDHGVLKGPGRPGSSDPDESGPGRVPPG